MVDKKETRTTASEVQAEVKEAVMAVEKAAADTAKAATRKVKEAGKKGTPGRKPGSKKAPAEIRMVIQYQNNDTEIARIEEKVKAQFVAEGHRAGAIKKLDIYIKPEEYAAYYVINEKFSGRVDLF